MKHILKHYKNRILGFPKTLYFNIRYFGVDGLKFPVILSHKVKLKSCKGEIKIKGRLKKGMFIWGYTGIPIATMKEISVWNNLGTVILKGFVNLGVGTKIYVGKGAELSLGNNFEITANSAIICEKKIEFGDDCLISWDVQIMDTDAHSVISSDTGVQKNMSRPIRIGNHVWVGLGVLILKGAEVPNNCVIAARSVIRSIYTEENAIIKSVFANKIIHNINWKG